jgi:tricorn protease
MRFPDIHGDTIVFVYGEDIWTVPADGGVATRLTIHDGQERFPRFSPDGSMIAFTGEYDGNADVYVMNAHGGDITRVTYHPGGERVAGWHPTKNKIMFISGRQHWRFARMYLVSPDGSDMEEVVLYNIAHGSFSSDGKKIAYNKVRREHRTWKRYKGGLAQEIYLCDLETLEERNLTNFERSDRLPMWIGNKIYFSSDRDGVLNIYVCDPQTGSIEQITHHTEYDVRRPSMGGNKIVYELGGSLWVLDVETRQSHMVQVEIKADLPEARPVLVDVKGHIQGFDCSPGGKRALIVARGEVFTVPKENGPTRNLTQNCGTRDKDAAWSPDGKTIAYLSDASGEYEIYLGDPMGRKEAIRLTKHENGYRRTLRWSPDGKKIAFADHTLRCYYLDIATKKITEIDKAYFENQDISLDLKDIYDFTWSPDSRHIAYSKMDEDLVTKVYVYSLETGKIHCVSQGIFNDFGPVFTKDGQHLLFVSNRRFDPTFCDFEWEMVYKKAAGIYALTLRKDGQPLLPFQSDEEGIASAPPKAKNKSKKDQDEGLVVIDFDGIADRIEVLPLPMGNYRNLAVNESALYYLNKDEGDFNRFEFRAIFPKTLYAFSWKTRKEDTVIEDIDGYKLSANGTHIVYKKGSSVSIIDAGARHTSGEAVDLSDLKMWLDPRTEWKQIFDESWRLERDYYYEPDMHSLDWPAMKEKYGKLLPYASCRQDIQYIVGELIGELNTSHTYVYGGDRQRRADRVNIGMLGTDWEVDKAANRYRFKKILRVADWTRDIVPPLIRPGVHVKKGDYLLRVNGEEVSADRNVYSYFQDLAGKQITITVNSKPTLAGAKEYTIKPLRGENTLRYLDWVEHNRKVAEKASDGQIGYIHLPDTYLNSAREFPKYFYAQMRKKGLIIDGRFNGGGLDPDIFLRRLTKPLHAYWTRRYSHDQTVPDFVTTAHMVCLTNKQAGSGGDMLPMEFQMMKMGPVIGTRTWGGLVGVSMFLEMIDGGGLTVPDYRIYGPDGSWIVENEGITPDIIIDLDPAGMAKGFDAQLMKGIEVLMKKIEVDPRPWPEHEAIPNNQMK